MSSSFRLHWLYPARLLCAWISQARTLKRVAISFSRSSLPRDRTCISCIAGRFFLPRSHLEQLNGGGKIMLRSRVGIWSQVHLPPKPTWYQSYRSRNKWSRRIQRCSFTAHLHFQFSRDLSPNSLSRSSLSPSQVLSWFSCPTCKIPMTWDFTHICLINSPTVFRGLQTAGTILLMMADLSRCYTDLMRWQSQKIPWPFNICSLLC